MKYLRSLFYLIVFCGALQDSFSQCSFEYLSNDTMLQDYIEFVYPRKDVDEIITIGSQQERGIINDSIFNAPVFQSFDYCGNILAKIIYKYIGYNKLNHGPIPTHNTYKYEPIGNTAILIKEDEFLLVDKASDTLLKEPVLILFNIKEKGEVTGYKTFKINDHEAYHTTIKNVLQLKDGKILVILWDYVNEYNFFYFDEDYKLLYKKTYNLPRGIRSLKEIENGEFICTSLAYDSLSFQFYRLDTSGQIKWMVSPYKIKGSARQILIENNRIYIIGSVSYGGKGVFGSFIISDIDGNILKQLKFDTINEQSLCSVYVESDNSYVIAGYTYNLIDNRGEDVLIFKIDSNGSIMWSKLYNFKSSLGTTGPVGRYPDYGGFGIAKANDGGIITYGVSSYKRSNPGGVLHDDATLIKTENIIVSKTETDVQEYYKFEILCNPTNSLLDIKGPNNLIKYWFVYNLNGEEVINGTGWNDGIDVRKLTSGVYPMRIVDRNNNHYFLKLVKI